MRSAATRLMTWLAQGGPATNGYRVLDVRQAPDRPGREFVFVTQRSA
ncbi:hypothetical protein GCM10027186_12120 [Micromonospora schwarzwaldensis]